MLRINCSEIWGGNSNQDVDLCTSALTASLFSKPADGGKGGDIYYFSVCGADRLTRIAVADVVGHGEAVSDISSWLYEGLHQYMNSGEGTGILDLLNTRAKEKDFSAITTAALVSFYHADNRALIYSTAGHPPAFVQRQGRGAWQPLHLTERPDDDRTPSNLPLGIMPETVYDQQEAAVNPGDRVFIYTDGVLEAPNAAGDLFGEARLEALLNHAGNAPLHEVKQAVLDGLIEFVGDGYVNGHFSHDDVTLMAVAIE